MWAAFFGYLSYDAVRHFETSVSARNTEEPELCFFEPEVLACVDNRRHTLELFSRDPSALEAAVHRLSGPLPPHAVAEHPWKEPHVDTSDEQFASHVRQAIDCIRAGDIIQVVLSRQFILPRVASVTDIYRGLRTINPSPYLYLYATPHLQLAGASPEVMVRIDDGVATVRPIAGTRPRGGTAQQDDELQAELLADPKERAEHVMLVDLGRNDVGRIAEAGSVTVPQQMVVERYSHVMHIVSEVRGHLRPEVDAFDTLRATFPAGTLSGAPKVRAMQIIDEIEVHRPGHLRRRVGMQRCAPLG